MRPTVRASTAMVECGVGRFVVVVGQPSADADSAPKAGRSVNRVDDEGSRKLEEPPLDIDFSPITHPRLPVEVVTRSEMRTRVSAEELSSRQRMTFHQLILCFSGEGTHYVDFEPIPMRPGTLLHVHPGQVQEFRFEPEFDAHLVVYRPDLHRTFIPGQEWFPGSDVATLWQLSDDDLDRAESSVRELRAEQDAFDGSPAYVVLLESLLTTVLARLYLIVGEPTPTRLPQPFIDFRHYLEQHLRARPTVRMCASELGYSTRTLDRACQAAVGRTAKQVLDDRIAFEVKRLLTHTEVSVARIGAAFGFVDASSFSKFVRRQFGVSPTALRENPALVGR